MTHLLDTGVPHFIYPIRLIQAILLDELAVLVPLFNEVIELFELAFLGVYQGGMLLHL